MNRRMATLVLTDEVRHQLADLAADPVERAAVLLIGTAAKGSTLRVLARELWEPPAETYASRSHDGLELTSTGWAPALQRAETLGAAAMFVHNHPGGTPLPSPHDRVVDDKLGEPFRIRSGREVYGSIVVSPTEGPAGFSLTGHVTVGDVHASISRIVVAGGRLVLDGAFDHNTEDDVPALYSRQVQAFGGDVQRVLGQLRIGVAGAGGTGSAVLEQLVRLGVRHIYLADPDALSESNVTRVYGSCPADVGRLKVEIQVDHLSRLADDLDIRVSPGKTTDRAVVEELTSCDLVFGCTDDEGGRVMLSRLAAHYLVPLIDCGVLLSSTNGLLEGIDTRVTSQFPGAACLLCRNRVDLERASAEMLDEDELAARQKEGYAPELAGIEPAVISFTSLTAALAVAELLERLIGYGVTPAPTELIARIHDRELSINTRAPRDGHYCHPSAGVLGTGDQEPFLAWTWKDTPS